MTETGTETRAEGRGIIQSGRVQFIRLEFVSAIDQVRLVPRQTATMRGRLQWRQCLLHRKAIGAVWPLGLREGRRNMIGAPASLSPSSLAKI